MIILGLGSNLGDRLAYLRQALRALKQVSALHILQVSPVYISDALLPDNAVETWDLPYFNACVRCSSSLTPHELLIHVKKIEQEIGRKAEKRWGPRVIDIDILAWDDLVLREEKLQLPHVFLLERPFALWPLADIAPRWVCPAPGPFQGKTATEIAAQWGSRFTGEAPLCTRQIAHRIDTPQLVGIVNVTPDSFSDGNLFLSADNAVDHAKELILAGAEIIDIGAESTNPNATPIDSETEWLRLEPVLDALATAEFFLPPKISIDTYHPETAQKALLKKNVCWLNDVSALSAPRMREVAAQSECDVVVMHHLTIPANKQTFLPLDQDPVRLVHEWARQQIIILEKAGIKRQRMIFDVGNGFGKTHQQSLELMQRMNVFHDLGVRLMVGHSRKVFMQQWTTLPSAERDIETVVVSLHLANQEVDYLRIHNVAAHSRAFKVAKAL